MTATAATTAATAARLKHGGRQKKVSFVVVQQQQQQQHKIAVVTMMMRRLAITVALCLVGTTLTAVMALSSSSSAKSTQTTPATNSWNRRQVFQHAIATVVTSNVLQPTLPAHAGGLLQFPITKQVPLKNKYHLMRAGWSELEHDGIYSTNPLFLTNRENQMHSPTGTQVVKKALDKLPQNQLPTVAYHSLAANGMDTGDLIARELKLGRDRLLPEFTYLDQRGIGLWDSSDMSIVKPALWALDELEAGPEGFGARPPPNEDGTPNETLHDQFIRLRQFLSLQESRTAGETILIIFPDGTGPALLSCMIAGIPFHKVHVLDMVPGELRLDVTPENIKALYDQRKDDPEYWAIIEDGKQKLNTLRQKQKDGTLQEWISLKDFKAEQEREELERQLQEKKLADEARAVERKKQEEARAKSVAEAKQKAEEERRRLAEEKKQKERQKQQELPAAAASRKDSDVSISQSGGDKTISFGALEGAAGLAALGFGALAIGFFANDTSPSSVNLPAAISTGNNTTTSKMDLDAEEFADGDDGIIASLAAPVDLNPSASMDEDAPNDGLQTLMTDEKDETRDFVRKMEMAEQNLKNALTEAAEVKTQRRKSQDSAYADPYIPDYDDDGANDWLRVLTEIRDEDEEDAIMMDFPFAQPEELVPVNGDKGRNGDALGPTNSTWKDI